MVQAAVDLQPVSSEELIAILPAAKVRIRSVAAGASLEHIEFSRPIVTPAGLSTAPDQPLLSADACWIGIRAQDGRETRIWSALRSMPSSEPIIHDAEVVEMAFDHPAQYIWHIGRDGSIRATYIGSNRQGKPGWFAGLGEALTSIQLAGQGVQIQWLTGSQQRAAQEKLLQSISNEAVGKDPGAARIKERLEWMLGKATH